MWGIVRGAFYVCQVAIVPVIGIGILRAAWSICLLVQSAIATGSEDGSFISFASYWIAVCVAILALAAMASPLLWASIWADRYIAKALAQEIADEFYRKNGPSWTDSQLIAFIESSVSSDIAPAVKSRLAEHRQSYQEKMDLLEKVNSRLGIDMEKI